MQSSEMKAGAWYDLKNQMEPMQLIAVSADGEIYKFRAAWGGVTELRDYQLGQVTSQVKDGH